jgi:hypothetical protein
MMLIGLLLIECSSDKRLTGSPTSRSVGWAKGKMAVWQDQRANGRLEDSVPGLVERQNPSILFLTVECGAKRVFLNPKHLVCGEPNAESDIHSRMGPCSELLKIVKQFEGRETILRAVCLRLRQSRPPIDNQRTDAAVALPAKQSSAVTRRWFATDPRRKSRHQASTSARQANF